MNNIDIIKEIEKTINKLEKDPKEADTVKALKKQVENLRPCIHAKKGKPVKGCSSCGSWVECGNDKVLYSRVKSGVCAKCKSFEIANG